MHPFPEAGLQDFFRTYSITGFAVSKDERTLALSTNLGGTYNVWGLALPNTYPYPLTYQDQTPRALQFDPAGRYLLVGFDHDGDEHVQLFLVSPNGGQLVPLRQAEGRSHFFAGLSEDGNRVYYASDKENHMHLNGYVYDIETGLERTLYVGSEGATYIAAISDDEQHLVLVAHLANTNMPAYLWTDGVQQPLIPGADEQHVSSNATFFDGAVWFTTNYQSDRSYLARYDIAACTFQRVYALDDADLDDLHIHKPSRTAYLTASSGVEDRLVRFHLDSRQAEVIAAPFAVIQEMHVGESGALYALGRSDIDPFNIAQLTPDGDWRLLTHNRVMGISRDELSTAEVCRFSSFDGLEIEALWFPANPKTRNGYTVVWPHGGPQASERRAFRPVFQYLAYRGYNVFAPNFRGSSGYGAKFVKMVEGDWGHGPRLDMVESIEWLLREGRADRDKLFLFGGSYGGYMTLLLHGRHADYFQACVELFGPSNLFTFLESVPDHWKPSMKQWLGDPVEDRDRLIQDSPITYLDGMTKPMLVIQGAKDPRVVKAESDQIVAALRDKGVEVEYIVFEDEGHGFMKKENEIRAYGSAVAFFDRHRK